MPEEHGMVPGCGQEHLPADCGSEAAGIAQKGLPTESMREGRRVLPTQSPVGVSGT